MIEINQIIFTKLNLNSLNFYLSKQQEIKKVIPGGIGLISNWPENSVPYHVEKAVLVRLPFSNDMSEWT